MTVETVGFTSTQVIEATGVTYRQLYYWCREGWITSMIPAHGTGSVRVFSVAELMTVAVAVGLINRGWGTQAAIAEAKDLLKAAL